MRRVLVIRSVSFQQLDMSLEAVRTAFPGAIIELLTHEHGRQLASSYDAVSAVHVYAESGPFTKGWRPGPIAPWHDVVVPVANVTGAGFANVFELARSLQPDTVHRLNVAGEIVPLTAADLDRLRRRDRLARAVAAVAGPLLGAAASGCFGAAAAVARLAGRPRMEGR